VGGGAARGALGQHHLNSVVSAIAAVRYLGVLFDRVLGVWFMGCWVCYGWVGECCCGGVLGVLLMSCVIGVHGSCHTTSAPFVGGVAQGSLGQHHLSSVVSVDANGVWGVLLVTCLIL
jgi:hypothetical protein